MYSMKRFELTSKNDWHLNYTVFIVRLSIIVEIKKPPLPKGRGTTEGGGGIYE